MASLGRRSKFDTILKKIQEAKAELQRGFRSNTLLNEVRPHFHDKQKWLLSMDYLEVLYGGSAGGGKLLPLDTPVPTSTGWTTVGNLSIGTKLFDEKGRICAVTHLFDIEKKPKLYRFTFDDGTTIDSCENHKWWCFSASELASLSRQNLEWRERRRRTRPSKKGNKKSKRFSEVITARNKSRIKTELNPPTGTVRSTAEIYSTFLLPSGRSNYAIPVATTLEAPDIDLSLDPYCLGCWLGDGTSKAGSITGVDSGIFAQFKKAGFKILGSKTITHTVKGLVTILRKIGVYDNKHVPTDYLRSSPTQRLSLLQGLMDTDGSVNSRGKCEFSNANRLLSDAVAEIVNSLGGKAVVRPAKSMLRGKEHRTRYRVKFSLDLCPFRLKRKAKKWKPPTRRTTKFRYIIDVKEIPSRPGRCLKVSSPNGLFLVGRQFLPTHNSDALLAAALQYIDIPGYAAIIFRRTYADLALAGALMDRANKWLSNTIMRKHDGGKKWSYPGGGTIEFGYLADEGDWERYQSAEYQSCSWDELTQLPEMAYVYLFSRLRKGAAHCPLCFKTAEDTKRYKPKSDCGVCSGTGVNPLSHVPIRARAATNPGGVHGEWVKRHFVPKAYLLADEEEQFSHIWCKKGKCLVCNGLGTVDERGLYVPCYVCHGLGKTERYFLPARLEDNPSIDRNSYERSLAMLPAQQRAQLRHGRWDFMSDGSLFLKDWFRDFYWRGEHIELGTNSGKRLIDKTRFTKFMTADTASKTKTTNDYTVICTWALCFPTYELCLLDVFRSRILVPEILPTILEYRTKWDAHFVIIEEASSGIGIIQEITNTSRGKGLTVLPYNPHGSDKVARSQQAQIRMKEEKIFFPESKTSVVSECLNELLLFYDPDTHDDFVDNLSMAAWYAAGQWRKVGAPGNPGSMVRRGLPSPTNRFRQF